jgi:RHS repeat-associated protein
MVPDPHPLMGSMLYTHAPAIDRPLTITRMLYTEGGVSSTWWEFTRFTIIPYWNTRGVAEEGGFGDGSATHCQTIGGGSRCVNIAWAGDRFSDRRYAPEAAGFWHGGLLNRNEDGGGMLFKRNRYYDTKTGNFTQEDPIGVAGGLNLYGYAGGDPANLRDPFGLCPSEMRANTICLAMFIEGEVAGFLVGDGRGFMTQSAKGKSRAYIVIDTDDQSVLDKGFSGTCTTWGWCNGASGLSQIDAFFQPNGSIDVGVVGHSSMTIVPGFAASVRFTPNGDGGFSAQGFATRFPSIEAYFFGEDGSATSILQQRGGHPFELFMGVYPLR